MTLEEIVKTICSSGGESEVQSTTCRRNKHPDSHWILLKSGAERRAQSLCFNLWDLKGGFIFTSVYQPGCSSNLWSRPPSLGVTSPRLELSGKCTLFVSLQRGEGIKKGENHLWLSAEFSQSWTELSFIHVKLTLAHWLPCPGTSDGQANETHCYPE